jgi:hypothetical protein
MELEIQYDGFDMLFKQQNETIFYGKRKSSPWKAVWALYDNANEGIATLSKIKQGWLSAKSKWEIKTESEKLKVNTFVLERFGSFKIHYEAKIGDDLYKVIPHKGYNTSIFKNETQIAYYENQVLDIGIVEKFKVTFNTSFDLNLLAILICGILCQRKTSRSTVTVDLGNSTERQKFDYNWKPD